jgi:hypothetical protein
MYLSGGQTIQRSMNGLLKITASEIDTTNASINNIDDVENISGAIGSDLVIDVDTGKIIKLKDNTQIDTNLNVIGNTHTGTLDVSNNSTFNGNVFSNLNLHTNTFDVSGNSIFNGNIFANLNTHTNTFDVSNASIFNGSITCKGITSNGVCNFNNPVLTNSSLTSNSIDVSNNAVFRSSIDVSTNSTFRKNLSVLGQLNVTGTTTLSGLTNVMNQLDVFQDSTFDKNIIVNEGIYSYGPTNYMDGSLNISGFLKVNRNLDVSANLYVGKNNPSQTSSVDLTGTIYLRDPSQPNVIYMRMYYEPALYGFLFQSEVQGRNMNFRVKDNAGNYKLFYFGAGQLYSAIFTYIDTGLNVSFNNRFTLGDSNGTTQWFGVSQMYVPNTGVSSGYVVYNKGLMNNATYYTNWVHVNTSNVDVPTMRMSWERIWSKVPHTMESTLTVAGNLTLTGNLIANSTTITPIELSYLDNVTSNIQTQLNDKLNLSGGTLSGSLTFSDSSVQSTAYTTALNTKLTAIGTTVTATLSATTNLAIAGIFNCGSMSLSPGTYMISCFCYVDVTGGSTTINNMSAAYSTSPTAYSHNVDATWSGGGLTYNSGSTFSLNHTDCIVVSSTTTYYMICRCIFGTILRMRFINTFSKFSAVRIA